MISAATCIGERRGLRKVTLEGIEVSEGELIFSELFEVCTVDPVSENLEFIAETWSLLA